MGRTVLLVENFWRTTQFVNHLVTASNEAADHEGWRVGTDRRGGETYWTPQTGQENAPHWLKVQCDRVRAADVVVIDRGSNLGAEVVRIQVSSDNLTFTDLAVCTIPTQVVSLARMDNANGVLTEEGAWIKRFPLNAGLYWRVYSDAMGAALKPEITGLFLGKSWRLAVPLVKPFSFGKRQLSYTELVSKTLWAATADVAQRRSDELGIRCETWTEYFEQARYHIEEQFLRGHRMWVVHDEDQAEKALMAYAPAGVAGFDVPQGRAFPEGRIPYHEHEPAIF